MNGNDLLRGFSCIGDELVDEALKKKVSAPIVRLGVPIAASIAAVIAVFSLWPRYQAEIPIAPGTDIPAVSAVVSSEDEKGYTLHFNRSDNQVARSLAIKGYFYAELTEEQKQKVVPQIARDNLTNGKVSYSHVDGVTSIVSVDTEFKVDDKDMKLTMSEGNIPKCYIFSGESVFSEIEGVKIDAGVFITDKNSRGEINYIYYADFKIDDIAYYTEFVGEKEDEKLFADVIAEIVNGERADFSSLRKPDVPELRDDRLTKAEAYAESDFGAYLPRIANGYQFNDATRFINQDMNYLSASFSQNYNDISIMISAVTENDEKRLVSQQDSELYDISLYPVPWGEHMSYEMQEIVGNPVFRAEELTLDMVKKREYIRGEEGDPSGNSVCMRFCVAYGDILVELVTEGVEAKVLFDELVKLPYE